MKKIKSTALAVLMMLSSLNLLKAQETQVKFFGQPEFQSQKVTKKGNYFSDPLKPGFPPVWKDSTYVDSTKSAFSTGNFVLFVTSQINERISVLSENTANIVNGNATFEVQRLMARFYVKDYFSVKVGKMFNPIGIWNNQYNMGLVLQPTIQRPSVIRASNDGGVLQIKNVGVQLEGENITKANLFYRVFVSNGNGSTLLNNNLKNQYAVTAAIGAEPIEGLKILGSAHYDMFSAKRPNSAGITNKKGGTAILSNVSVSYMNPEKNLEFIGEYYYQSSRFDSIGEKSSQGLLTYVGYKVKNNIIPYVQYAYLQAGTPNSTDFYFAGATNGIQIKVNEMTLGLRYKFNANFVVKAEYTIRQNQQIYKDNMFQLQNPTLPGYVAGDKTNTTISQGPRLQFAFAF